MLGWGQGLSNFNFKALQKSGFSLGSWVELLWLTLVENALIDLNPGIHAMWLWANVLLLEKCQASFFHNLPGHLNLST